LVVLRLADAEPFDNCYPDLADQCRRVHFAIRAAVTGPFTNVPGATSPYINSLTAPQQFFRLVAPSATAVKIRCFIGPRLTPFSIRLSRMKRELEALLKAYDAFKQTPDGVRKQPGCWPFMNPNWRRHELLSHISVASKSGSKLPHSKRWRERKHASNTA